MWHLISSPNQLSTFLSVSTITSFTEDTETLFQMAAPDISDWLTLRRGMVCEAGKESVQSQAYDRIESEGNHVSEQGPAMGRQEFEEEGIASPAEEQPIGARITVSSTEGEASNICIATPAIPKTEGVQGHAMELRQTKKAKLNEGMSIPEDIPTTLHPTQN